MRWCKALEQEQVFAGIAAGDEEGLGSRALTPSKLSLKGSRHAECDMKSETIKGEIFKCRFCLPSRRGRGSIQHLESHALYQKPRI